MIHNLPTLRQSLVEVVRIDRTSDGLQLRANLDYRVFPVVDSTAYGWVAGIAPASILSTISSTATS